MDKLIGVLEPAEVGAVMLWDGATGLLSPAAAFGYDQETFKAIALRLEISTPLGLEILPLSRR